ncbi:MAG TPA: aldose epimerase [Acidobacteriaceae bacterium]|nr:aldose epimerase [Acidobacteriaceae bacterium]
MHSLQEYTLQNLDLRVLIKPAEGGRVASLKSVHTGVEFLAQSQHSTTPIQPGWDTKFQNGACAGIEECIPTIGACGEGMVGGPVPDHGDFWQIDWTVTDRSLTRLHLEAMGFSRPLFFQKEISLQGNRLNIGYRVTNLSKSEVPFLYACHPLFAIEEGDRVCLAQEVSSLSLYYSRESRLGRQGTHVSWPVTSLGVNLERVLPVQTGFAEMLYTDRLHTGRCGLYRNAAQQGLCLHFDPAVLPYLGLWLCYGGWPESAVGPKQYAIALEPTFAPANTLSEAIDMGLAVRLPANESASWNIAFEISSPSLPLSQFRSMVKGSV